MPVGDCKKKYLKIHGGSNDWLVGSWGWYGWRWARVIPNLKPAPAFFFFPGEGEGVGVRKDYGSCA